MSGAFSASSIPAARRHHRPAARHAREISVALAYLALLTILALGHRNFFEHQFFETLVSAAPILIAAVGMTMIILARQIDISIGSQFAVCAVIAGALAQQGLPMGLTVCLTIIAGTLMGAINGVLVSGLGLPSIVVTLATLTIYRQTLRLVTQGQFINDLPAGFQWFGMSQLRGQWMLVIVAAVIWLAFAWGCRWLVAGRAVYAIGSDQEAARLAGIRPRRVVFALFALMGGLTALASVLQAVRAPDVDPNTGLGWELTVIAAVVVGGTSITGGRGTMIGTLIGVVLLASIGPALPFLGVASQSSVAISGIIMLLAVASDGLTRRES